MRLQFKELLESWQAGSYICGGSNKLLLIQQGEGWAVTICNLAGPKDRTGISASKLGPAEDTLNTAATLSC